MTMSMPGWWRIWSIGVVFIFDHLNVGVAVVRVGQGLFVVKRLGTNLVYVTVTDLSVTTPAAIVNMLADTSDANNDVSVLTIVETEKNLRLGFHCDVTRDMADKACAKLEAVLKSFL